MKKYIVVSYDNEQMYCPDLFPSEKEAYSFFARNVLEDIYDYIGFPDDEYEWYSNLFETQSPEVIRTHLHILTTNPAVEKYVKVLPHGYAFGTNFDDCTEVFEVEERR